MHDDFEQQPQCIDQQMPLAPAHFRRAIETPRPARWVFTDWLSMMAAFGAGSRPARWRTNSRSRLWSCSQMPACRHGRK